MVECKKVSLIVSSMIGEDAACIESETMAYTKERSGRVVEIGLGVDRKQE